MDFKVTDLVKNVVLAGIGAAAVTTEKAKDVADELVKKGSLTVEQGKVLNEELKHNIKETLDNKDASVEELLSAMTPDQIDALKELLNKASKPKEEEPKAEAPQDEEQKAEQKENTQDE